MEAGKKAASTILTVRKAVIIYLQANKGVAKSATQIADAIGQSKKTKWVFKILENLAVNQSRSFERISVANPLDDQFLAL